MSIESCECEVRSSASETSQKQNTKLKASMSEIAHGA